MDSRWWLAAAPRLGRHPVKGQRAVTAALALLYLVVGQSIVTVSGLWSTHLIVLFPLPQMVIATFAVSLATRSLCTSPKPPAGVG